jgi:hypothetical protein
MCNVINFVNIKAKQELIHNKISQNIHHEEKEDTKADIRTVKRSQETF